jgi:hypothetical protein
MNPLYFIITTKQVEESNAKECFSSWKTKKIDSKTFFLDGLPTGSLREKKIVKNFKRCRSSVRNVAQVEAAVLGGGEERKKRRAAGEGEWEEKAILWERKAATWRLF